MTLLHRLRLKHHGITDRPRHVETPIKRVNVSAYLIPTEGPESDGTLQWQETVLVLVKAEAGGKQGLGYSYAGLATAQLIRELLVEVVEGHDAMAVADCWKAMLDAVRNVGRPGVASMGI